MRAMLIVVAVLVVTGCGTESGPSSAPSASPSTLPAPPAPPIPSDTEDSSDIPSPVGPPCDVVSDSDATSWAGTPQRVSGPEQVGSIERCLTVVDVEDSLGLTWSFAEAAPLKTLVEQENVDGSLKRRDLELAGGTPAVLLRGQVVGSAFTQVITLLDDDRALVVEARDTGLGETPRSLKELGRVATQVAEAYTR